MSSRSTQRIERNCDTLIALHKLSQASKRAILPALNKDTLLALVECAKDVIIGNVTLYESQLHYTRRHEQKLRSLVQKGTPDAERVRILQKGRTFDEDTGSSNSQKGGTDNRSLRQQEKIKNIIEDIAPGTCLYRKTSMRATENRKREKTARCLLTFFKTLF